MSWASERLLYLTKTHTYRDIAEITGIPVSTISYVIRGERILQGRYHLPLRSMYERQVYGDLRALGMSAQMARRFRSFSTERIVQYQSKANEVVNMLVDYRFEAYKASLIKQNKFVSDDETRRVLVEAISKSIVSSPTDYSKDEGKNDSPSIRHILELD